MWRPKQYFHSTVQSDSSVYYFSRSSNWCWACCTKKLFSTCGVKILEKYLWQCTFFSKVACWRPATWLKLASLTGNFKGFWPQIQSSCKFYKRFLKKTFFAEHFTLTFSIFQLIYKTFQSISILFWHPTAQQVSGIACFFSHAEILLASEFLFIFDCQEIAHAY